MKRIIFSIMILVITFSFSNPAAFSAEKLTEDEEVALYGALQNEYKNIEAYRQVIDQIGNARPFSNIIETKQKHVEEILAVYERYDVTAPENKSQEAEFSFDSIGDACKKGAQAEEASATLYKKLMAMVDKYDVLKVLRDITRTTEGDNLRAFTRCLERRNMTE